MTNKRPLANVPPHLLTVDLDTGKLSIAGADGHGGADAGLGGSVQSVVAGTNVTVNNADPANPIVSATGGGGATWLHNEVQAAQLVNATSAGDAGGRSDHFNGSSLSAPPWVLANGANLSTIVGNGVLVATSTGAFSAIRRPYTPTGAFRVEVRVRRGNTNGVQVMLCASDSNAGPFNGEAGIMRILDSTGGGSVASNFTVGSLDASTYNDHGSVTINESYGNTWWYIALARNGSNTWTGYYSADRIGWHSVGSFSKTLTVAQLGFYVTNADASSIDFIDVVS